MINSTIRLMQQRLGALGIPVAVDGIMGPETRAAVTQLQTRLGLPATGKIDGPTLSAALKAPAPVPPIPQLRPAVVPGDALGTGKPPTMVPPLPQLRPGDVAPPVRLGTGQRYPGGIPAPSLRPGDVPQPVFAGQLGGTGSPPPPRPAPVQSAATGMPPPNAPARTAPWLSDETMGKANRIFPQPSFETQQRLDNTRGAQSAGAAWMRNLPANLQGIQTGGMGMTGPMPQGQGGGSGLPNRTSPMAGQAGPRDTPTATADQRAAATAALRSALLAQGVQPIVPPGAGPPGAPPPSGGMPPGPPQGGVPMAGGASPGFTPTPSNPGYGLPGLPPSPTFMGAVGNAAGAAGNAIGGALGGLLGNKPAQASPQGPPPGMGGPPPQQLPQLPMPGPQGAPPQGPAPGSGPPPASASGPWGASPPAGYNWAPGGADAAGQSAAKQVLRMQLMQMLLGARIAPQQGPNATTTLSAQGTPPNQLPLSYP